VNLNPFRDAMVAIIDGDFAVEAVTGRSSMNLLARGAQMYEPNLPLLTYFVVYAEQERGIKGRATVIIQVEAWAKNLANAFTVLETLIDRAEALFVGAAFTAQSVDVQRIRIVNRRDRPVEEGVRSIGADFHFKVAI
jgi:hypothetical protein